MIYLFNNNEEMIRIIPNSAIKRMYQTQTLTDENYISDRLDVEIQALNDEELSELEYMAVDDIENPQRFHYYFIVKETTEHQITSLTGVQSGIEELRKTPVYDMRPTNLSPKLIADRLLEGTNWQAGYTTDDVGTISTNFYYTDVFSALKKMCMAFGIEMQFFVEITTNRIGARYIEFRKRTGKSVGKRVVYGHNALKIVKEVEKTNTVTALIGRGKGVQVSESDEGNIGYGRKIGFENIVWKTSSGAPVDKPLGQEFVEIPELTLQYGIKNSNGTVRPKIGFVEFQDEESETRLIDRTYNALLELSRPQVLLETSSVYLPDTGIGDTINVVRHDRDLRYQTRVFEITWDRLANQAVDMKLGDRLGESENKRISRISNQVSGNVSTELGPTIDELVDRLTTADGKNTNWYTDYDPMENPETMGLVRVNDNWWQPDPEYEGEFILKQWNGEMWVEILRTSGNPELVRRFEEVEQQAQDLADEIEASEGRATDKANQALQDAKDWAEAEDARIKQEVDGAIEIAEQAKQSAKDSEAKAEAIKQGLGLADTTLTNQQITELIRQEFNSIKSTADTANQAFVDLNNEYQTFLIDRFNPALTKAADTLSLAEQNRGLFYSTNLIDEVTGQSNVYTKAEIDGTNGYVTKATFNANAESISSEFERIEGVALASGANINLLITRNQKVNTWLDANPETRTYPTPNDTTNPIATSPDLISVTPGEKITLSKTTAPIDNYFRIDYLDADKKYVNRYTQNANVATITIPENVAYLWVSYPLDSYPKIERGDVKTQWTLAPQDQVNQSTVNYLTSKIEQTPEMITDALTSYTKTDNLDNTVASYLTNTTTKTAGAIETKLSDYQTTSDLDGDIVKLLDNTTSQTAGKFNNKLQALEGKIPTEFGGRNLLRGTADFDTTLWRNVSTAIPSTRDSRYKQVRVDGDYMVAPITTMSVQGWNFEIGKEYVVSVYAKSEILGNKLGVTVQSTPYFEPQVVAVSEWRRYVWKFKATTSGLANFRFETRNGERVWITQPQIEKGSIPTDWTRAVEDLATVVQTNEIERTANYTKSAINNVTKDGLVTGSTINQTNDGITERVARLDTNGNVSYSNRDVKLDSIVSTVANDSYISNIIQTSDLVQSTIRENTNVDLLARSASGTSMTADPHFNKGINGLGVYDNASTNTISIYRNLNNDPNLPGGKGYRLDIYHASSTATDPHRGGIYLAVRSWANGVVVVRFTAKLDVGRSFVYAQDQIGTGATHGWLTSNKGTGKWEQYAHYYRFGTSGTFGAFGFLAVDGTSAAFTWRLSEFDIINLGMSSQSQITQLQDNINLRVTKGDVLSQINIEAERTLIQSKKLVLDANSVTFTGNAFIPSAQIVSLDAGKITAGEIETARLKTTEIVSQGLSGNEESITNLVIGEDVFTSSVTNIAKQKVADELKQEYETVLSPIHVLDEKDHNGGETFSLGKYFYYNGLNRDVPTYLQTKVKHVLEITMPATQNKGQFVYVQTKNLEGKWVSIGANFNLPTGQFRITHEFTSTVFATSNADYRLVLENGGNPQVSTIYSMRIYRNDEVQVPIEGGNTGAISTKITQLYDMINLSVLGKEGAMSRIAMGEEGIQIDGKLLHITAKTYIDDAVIKSAMIDTLDAGKITTGELNASLIRVVNLDASSITGNEASFIKALFSGTKSTLQITSNGVNILDNSGRSSTYLDSSGIEFSRKGIKLGKLEYVTNSSDSGDLNNMHGFSMRPNRDSYFGVSYFPTSTATTSLRSFAVSGKTGNVYIAGLIKPSEQQRYGINLTWGGITGRGTNVRIMNHNSTGGIQIDNGDISYLSTSGWRSLNDWIK